MAKPLITKPPIEEVIKKIFAVLKDKAAARRIMTRATGVLSNSTHAAKYPPETDRNSFPGHRGDGVWYQRGFGTRYATRGASIGGNPFYQGFRGRDTSQDLDRSWRTDVGDYKSSVYTEVTYAPFLLDDSVRPRWAAEVGWQTMDDIVNDFTPEFIEIVLDEVDDQIDKI